MEQKTTEYKFDVDLNNVDRYQQPVYDEKGRRISGQPQKVHYVQVRQPQVPVYDANGNLVTYQQEKNKMPVGVLILVILLGAAGLFFLLGVIGSVLSDVSNRYVYGMQYVYDTGSYSQSKVVKKAYKYMYQFDQDTTMFVCRDNFEGYNVKGIEIHDYMDITNDVEANIGKLFVTHITIGEIADDAMSYGYILDDENAILYPMLFDNTKLGGEYAASYKAMHNDYATVTGVLLGLSEEGYPVFLSLYAE